MYTLRVVVADDSPVSRALLLRALGRVDAVQIVAEACNGAEAVEAVRQHAPDLLTLDLHMPVMDGLAALQALREAKADCEVIVISAQSLDDAPVALEALQRGAVDFIAKPAEANVAASVQDLAETLRRQLAAVRLRRERHKMKSGQANTTSVALRAVAATRPSQLRPEMVVIGASTGGPAALPVVLTALPRDFPLPILIVQHMPPLFTTSLADSINRKTALTVSEGHQGRKVEGGHVYIAPGGHHLKVQRAFDKSVRLAISDDVPEHHCRPSVDVLFRSVAEEFGGRVIAVIMTGMGNDGVAGLRVLKSLGAYVIAQSEDTCAVFGMPQEAIRAAVVDAILPLEKIAAGLLTALDPNGRQHA
jgi:two-component system chemotaxis response regulator CheB